MKKLLVLIGISTYLMGLTWTGGGLNDNWNNVDNWDGVSFPNAAGVLADFTTPTAVDVGVTIGQSITVGEINVDNSGAGAYSFEVTTLANFIFDNSGSAATLSLVGSNPSSFVNSTSAYSLAGGLEIDSDDAFAFDGQIVGTGPVTINSVGTITFGDTITPLSSTYTGGTEIQSLDHQIRWGNPRWLDSYNWNKYSNIRNFRTY